MSAETRFRNASAILLIIGVHLVIPKISEVTASFTDLAFSNPKAVASKGTTSIKKNLHKISEHNHQGEEFEPPNYGGPDSERGSGSR